MSRKGRGLELDYAWLYKLNDEYTITSPAKLYDKIAKEEREVDVLLEYYDKDNIKRSIAVETRNWNKKQSVKWPEQLIAKKNDIEVDYLISVSNQGFSEGAINKAKFINKFNYKELKEKYGIRFRNERDAYVSLEYIFKNLRIMNPELIYKKDNHIFYKSKNDKTELLALWLERCYRVVQEQKIEEYNKNNIESLVEFIKEEGLNNKFNKAGIE